MRGGGWRPPPAPVHPTAVQEGASRPPPTHGPPPQPWELPRPPPALARYVFFFAAHEGGGCDGGAIVAPVLTAARVPVAAKSVVAPSIPAMASTPAEPTDDLNVPPITDLAQCVEPFLNRAGKGYMLNRKTYVRSVRHLSEMPMYLQTDPGGIVYILKQPPAAGIETTLERLCDRLGGQTGATPSSLQCGSRGTWKATLTFYGKQERVLVRGRGCAAPLVCPNMPPAVKNRAYKMPDEEDDIIAAAAAHAELQRNPAYIKRASTTAFYHAHANDPCPYTKQDYDNLGQAQPRACPGKPTLRRYRSSDAFFIGCSAWEANEPGHRFLRLPESVDPEHLDMLLTNDGRDPNQADHPPAGCLYMQPRWARSRTCPFEADHHLSLVWSGSNPTGKCPVKLLAYCFDNNEALKDNIILALHGEHTHPRAVPMLHLGKFRSRVFTMLDEDPTSTKAMLARRVKDQLGLQPSSSAVKHILAEHKLSFNPLGEDQVRVMARLAASAGSTQYIRKIVFGAKGGNRNEATYHYVTFFLDDLMDIAALHGSFMADMSYKDFTTTDDHGDWHLFSITVWSHRLKRTLTVLKDACIGECEDLYRELIDEFCR